METSESDRFNHRDFQSNAFPSMLFVVSEVPNEHDITWRDV